MEIIKTRAEMEVYVNQKSITGFVPTMGALHKGHISLIKRSKSENSRTICSIFVNPTQFNNPEDLKSYPRTPETDFKMLEEAGCNAVFYPEAAEIYPEGSELTDYNFGNLAEVMEGEFRPGHFKGMANVVYRLLSIVKPDYAYFGEKDYQQMKIVENLVLQTGLPLQIVACAIIRESDGLAMSSRNIRLNSDERTKALTIYRTLLWMQQNCSLHTAEELVEKGTAMLTHAGLMQTEYVDIRRQDDLSKVQGLIPKRGCRAFIATWVGKTRLIDNMELEA